MRILTATKGSFQLLAWDGKEHGGNGLGESRQEGCA